MTNECSNKCDTVLKFVQKTMIFEFLVLIIVGSNNCKSELENVSKLSTTRASEAFENNIESCYEIKHTFDVNHDLKLLETSVTSYVLEDLRLLAQKNEYLDQYNFDAKQLIFENKTELLLSTAFERTFEKLADIRDTKLNEVVLTLSSEKPLSYEYVLLNAFDVIYNKRNNRTEVEKLLKIRIPNENTLNSSFVKNKTYYDYGYFDSFSEEELKSHAKCLICAFLTLANLTNSYYSVKKLIQPLEVIIGDDKSSTAMLIFINEFLTKAMEGNGDIVNIYRNLSMKYIINQLQTVDDAFNISELLSLQNKSDLGIRNDFEKLKQLDPGGVLTLALDWRFKLKDVLDKTDVSEYFHIMDKIFRELLENRNAERIVNYRTLSASDDVANRKALIFDVKKQIKTVTKTSARVQRVLAHIKAVTADPETSTMLLEFANEFLNHLNSSRMNIMPTVYNYIARELSAIEPIDASIFKMIRDKKMEELASIVNEHITKDPGSIITMALDWVFELKIEFLTHNKNGNIFEILKNTLKHAKARREERLKKNTRVTAKSKAKPLMDLLEFDAMDELLLRQAINQ